MSAWDDPVAVKNAKIADMVYARMHDAWLPLRPHRMSMVCDEDTYRLAITKKGKVEVMCFGFTSVDRELKPSYNSVDDLPNWVKERLAVLSIVDPTPPTPEVEGVGRRISKNVFWVYHPDWRTI